MTLCMIRCHDIFDSSYLLVVVEAVHNGGLSGRQLGNHVQQLQNNFLLVVNDGQMQSTVIIM